MLGSLREQYQRVMMPIGRALARTGITPNMITGLTVLVALVSAWYFAMGDLLIGFVFMVLTVVMDMFDGAVVGSPVRAPEILRGTDHIARAIAKKP